MKKRILAFLLAVSIAVSMLVLPASAAGNANTAVQLSITLNAMDSSQQAALNAVVTRGALARMLVSYSTYRESVGSQGTVGTLFTDLPGTSPYAPYVRIAVQNGWMNGYTDGSFRPDNAVTLEEDEHILTIIASMIAHVARARQNVMDERVAAIEENMRLRNALSAPLRPHGFVGNSDAMRLVYEQISQVAPSTTTVLLYGESGTGKELAAHAIHSAGKRNKGPFISLNCAALPENLIESELFGHRAGSFTGATKDKKGLFEEADKGTLFLDEIGEMPVELQAKLLRVLECGEFIKIGETRPTKVDLRIIAATNRDLEKEIASGNFREDLFFRLSVFRIHLPSLRERPGDIAEYARFFAAQFADRMGRRIDTIDKGYIAALERHAWHGNVRELRNVVERSLIMAEGNALTVGCLSPEFHAASCDGSVPDSMALDALERHHILRVLEYTKGNKAEAARLLGIGIATLYRKLESYGMKP